MDMSRRSLLGSSALAFLRPGRRKMAAWGTELIQSRAGQLVTAGDGPVLWFNSDASVTVYLGENSGITSVLQTVTPLPPLSWVAFDGMSDVWAVCPVGQTAAMYAYPGGSNFFQLVEIIVKTILISATQGNGLFVYSGTPALNDLIASIVSPATTEDPFGNPTEPGFVSYVGTGAATEIAQLYNAQLSLGRLTNNSLGVVTIVNTSGLQLASPTVTALDQAAIVNILSEAAAPGHNGPVVDIVTGALQSVAGTAANPTAIVTDGTHALGALGVANLNISVANYYLLPDTGVWITIKGAANGAVAGGTASFPNSLLAAYRPGTETLLPAEYGGTIAAGEQRPRLQIQPNGLVTLVFPALVNGNIVSAGGRFDVQ